MAAGPGSRLGGWPLTGGRSLGAAGHRLLFCGVPVLPPVCGLGSSTLSPLAVVFRHPTVTPKSPDAHAASKRPQLTTRLEGTPATRKVPRSCSERLSGYARSFTCGSATPGTSKNLHLFIWKAERQADVETFHPPLHSPNAGHSQAGPGQSPEQHAGLPGVGGGAQALGPSPAASQDAH